MSRSFTFVSSLVAVAAALVIASSAAAVTVPFTNSNQLNLTGRDVLSAVNFYDSTPVTAGSNQQVTGTIQGVSFLNLDHQTQTVAGALTASFPHAGDGRSQSGVNIVGTGADTAIAVQLARATTYWSGSSIGSLSYAFGPTYANRLVEVQLIGGDSGWTGLMDVKVAGISQGTMQGDSNDTTVDLLTFSHLTDGAGNLVLNMNLLSGNFYGLAGAIVTADVIPPAPEPSSLALLACGALVVAQRRRAARKSATLV